MEPFKLKTIIAERHTETIGAHKGLKKTILFNEAGEFLATIPAGHSQPSTRRKKIVYNCWTYLLQWRKAS